ncbi:HNH endonuclease [candidate division WOR-3 bacterium]|nr:HNH endonuclease [candidate division WOR-3 bacterium]
MKEIPLTQGKVAIVDDEVYIDIGHFKWQLRKGKNTYYVFRHSPIVNGERHTIYMHWEVIGKPPKGFVNDHRDGNGLNNLRENLRHVTIRQNGQNLKHGKRYSQYPGVSWHARDKKWVAMIRINGPQKWLGTFDTELEAFEAYRQAVNEIGETVINTK